MKQLKTLLKLTGSKSKVMKKLITLLLLVCGAVSLQAQDLRVGPKLGINSAKIYYSDNFRTDLRIGIRGGAFLEISLSDEFFIQPELLFSSKGYAVSTQRESTEVIYDYLSVPVMAKYAFVNNENWQVFGQAGPYIGILMPNAASTASVSTDMGGQFGAGAAYSVGPGSIMLDVRAGFGVTDITNGGSSTINQVLPSITAGYAFAL